MTLREIVTGRPRALTSVVAIPVCNEEERIGSCLSALAKQTNVDIQAVGVLLFLNNCVDGTATTIAATNYPFSLRILERTHASASAGWARRVAMEEGAAWLRESAGEAGMLLTTDADSRVSEDWIYRNCAAINAGADAAAGRIELDPVEAAQLPNALHERGRLESTYGALLAEVCARLNPEPGNPWPCHWCKSGATIAVTLCAYEAVGGMPEQPTGEDRAFIDKLIAHNYVVRHDPSIVVVTSGRLKGRAFGGVADTLRLRCSTPESPCDDRLESVYRVLMRCRLQKRLKNLWSEGEFRDIGRWAPSLGISRADAQRIAKARFFEEAYLAVQAASSRLRFQPVIPRQLRLQIWIARLALRIIRARDGMALNFRRQRREVHQRTSTLMEVDTISSVDLSPCPTPSEHPAAS